MLPKLARCLYLVSVQSLCLELLRPLIEVAYPHEDKPLLLEASTILNKEIEQIPDKGNALILAALNLAFQSLKGTQVSDDDSNKINQIISSLDDALN